MNLKFCNACGLKKMLPFVFNEDFDEDVCKDCNDELNDFGDEK